MSIFFTTTAFRIYSALAVFAVLWFGVSTYNGWVSAAAVKKNDSHWAGEFGKLSRSVSALTAKINDDKIAARQAAADAVAAEQEKANAATRKYHAELAKNKTLASQLAAARNTELVGSLLDSTRPISDRGGSECASLRAYASDVGTRYASCERDLEIAIGEAAKAVDRAATAEAGIRALNKEE